MRPARENEGGAHTATPSLPIVGIGASAGGLEAFSELLRALPIDTGMGFVLVQHLSPAHPSQLAEILSRTTKMPVVEVRDKTLVKANHIYVIPPDREMIISKGTLQLRMREKDALKSRPVDQFLRSLATDQGQQSIGVILSGTGNDGTLGLAEIKGEGGITFAQDDSAQHDGMPRSAIASGCVDFVMTPREIAREIARVAHHPYVAPPALIASEHLPGRPSEIGKVLQILGRGTGVDFSHYKEGTLRRRITRRMVLKKMDGLNEYARLCQNNSVEVDALYQDILINVTSFFRNPELFEAIKTKVLPKLSKGRSRHDPIRVWTVGCSTGEEAYSLAIVFAEFAETNDSRVPIQIFATDLNEKGVEKARAGIYSKNIEQDISTERLKRFFTEVDGHYRISKAIREMTVFARHNLLSDPPFSKMDLISCRNLLIYLEPEMQQKILGVLHFALNPGGVLVLGGSETVGGQRDLFETLDARHRIYGRKPGAGRLPLGLGKKSQPARESRASTTRGFGQVIGGTTIQKEADRVLLATYAPPSVLIDADMEIVQVRGDTAPYLTPAPGKASLNLMKMVREGLQAALRSAVDKAKKGKASVRQERLRQESNGGFREVTLHVIPVGVRSGKDAGFLVLFEETDRTDNRPKASRKKTSGLAKSSKDLAEREIRHLTEDLAATREYLQSLVEQQEAANEELQSANEEAQSANEELQSVNEELETSKEEIEASNEELSTVNDELRDRNTELHQLSDDLANVIGSAQTPMVLVAPDLRIRRITPMAEKVLKLNSADVGRSISDIKINLTVPNLELLLSDVMKTGGSKEAEVQDKSGRWYSLRIGPYKTPENKIEGAVLLLVDVDELRRAKEYAESIVATVREPLLVLDPELRVQSANPAFYETFQVTPEETENRLLYDLGNGEWRISELRRLLEEILPRDNSLDDFEVEQVFEHIGRKIMLLSARHITRGPGDRPLILLAIEDVTHRTQLQRLGDTAVGDLPLDNLLGAMSNRLRQVFSADTCSILLLNAEEQTLRVRASSGLEEEVAAHVEIPLGRGVRGTVAATRSPVVIDDLETTELASPILRATVRSVAAVPILSGDDLRGVLELGSKTSRQFTETEIGLLRLAAEKVALAVDRSRLLEAERLGRRAADEANEAKDQFFATLSHELRTPMTAILGWTQLLERTSYDPEQTSAAIQNIDRSARTQARLIDDMLDVSRIVMGELSVRLEPVELRTIVENSIEAAQPAASERGIRIEATLNSATILGDRPRLRQVFGNLLANAIKFSQQNARILIAVERGDERVTISVTDEGRGIAPDFLPHVFERFRQSTKGEYGGLGLGLAIARHIINLHDGSIEAESYGEGKGATFRVVLPIFDDSDSSRGTQTSA